MRLKLLLASCLAVCCSADVAAQTEHDITAAYLKNAGFDTRYDYPVGETGNVDKQILDVEGWTKDIGVNYTITGVYQIGTAKTFNNTPIPAKGYDGTASGGVLALSTGWGQSLKYNQTGTLPAGTYAIVTAFYNPTAVTAGRPLTGWLAADGSETMTKKTSFPVETWMTDIVTFTLTQPTEGRIQIGFQATENEGSAKHAKVVLDFVKLLRDYPLNTADAELKKEGLKAELAKADGLYGDGSGKEAGALKAAIDATRAVCNDAGATVAGVETAVAALAKAVDAYLWANPTGAIPVVTTDKRYARGATMAFGRMTAEGDDIIERGFCWATHPDPTVEDNRTDECIEHKGQIFWMKNMKPSTLYYIRAYAISKGRQIGYGESLKIYTIRKGALTYSMRAGGDADARARIDAAMKKAVAWWNDLTNIRNVNFNVGHNPGTPTADCSYGGYIPCGLQ